MASRPPSNPPANPPGQPQQTPKIVVGGISFKVKSPRNPRLRQSALSQILPLVCKQLGSPEFLPWIGIQGAGISRGNLQVHRRAHWL